MSRAALVLTGLLLASGATFGGNSWNTDAGTGADAPDAPESALLIAEGTHIGRANSPKDADWYRLSDFTELSCIEVVGAGNTRSDMHLANGAYDFVVGLPEAQAVELAIASSGGARALVGFTPTPNPAGNEPSRPGLYGFDVQRWIPADLGPGDAATGGDAGGHTQTAIPLDKDCTAGTLSPRAGDAVDAYSFEGVGGDIIGLSFAGVAEAPLFLSLLSPSREELLQLEAGETNLVVLPQTGVYYLGVTESGDASSVFASGVQIPFGTSFASPLAYMIAFSDDPGHGCRPLCVS